MFLQPLIINVLLVALSLFLKKLFFDAIPFAPIPIGYFGVLGATIMFGAVRILLKIIKKDWHITFMRMNNQHVTHYSFLLLLGTIGALLFLQYEHNGYENAFVNILQSIILASIGFSIMIASLGVGGKDVSY